MPRHHSNGFDFISSKQARSTIKLRKIPITYHHLHQEPEPIWIFSSQAYEHSEIAGNIHEDIHAAIADAQTANGGMNGHVQENGGASI